MFLWILLKIHHTYCGIQAYACHWLLTTRGSKGFVKTNPAHLLWKFRLMPATAGMMPAL